MLRMSAKRSDLARWQIHYLDQSSTKHLSWVFGLWSVWIVVFFLMSTFIPWSELSCRGAHVSKYIYINSFIIQLSIPHPADVFHCFLSRGFYKALHSFPKHFSSLQLFFEWNKFYLANYLNRDEFILHISHRFSCIFLHSMNYSWSRINDWP